MKKLEIYLLKETLGIVDEELELNDVANFKYSDVMKSLYLYDFPDAWKKDENKKLMCTVGANDYFNKWTGQEFMSLDDGKFDDVLKLAKDNIVAGSIVDGKITGLPLAGGNHQLLFFNKEYTDVVPKTMEELIEAAEFARKKHKLDYGFVFPTGGAYFILPFLYGFGAPLWSDESEAIPYDSMYKLIEFLKKLIYIDKVSPIKWEAHESDACFINKKAAYCLGGDWNIPEYDKATNHNLGICKIPPLERECRATSNASYLFISKYLDKDLYENVREFGHRFLSDKVQKNVMDKLFRMPVSKDFNIFDYDLNEKLVNSYEVYKNSFILPAKKEVTHMYHVFADLLEPDILIKDETSVLCENVIKHLKDADSYYTNNLLKM